MPKYLVQTTAVVRRFYEVEAIDEKAAEEASCNCACAYEEDVTEETDSITEDK